MDSQPIRSERILQALEACRPGSDDLADPAMADLADLLGTDGDLRMLYERVQRIDASLGRALRDVPVPEGLAERIIERLAAARPGGESTGAESQSGQAPGLPTVAPPPPSPTRLRRRRLLAVAGGLATVAVSLAVALVYISSADRYDQQTALADAVRFFSTETHEPGHLLSDPAHQPPDAYPLSRDVRRLAGTRWRPVSGFLGREGVAYDLPTPGGRGKATLYVVALSVEGLEDTQPPTRPGRNTGGYCSGAWQVDRLLYVLVVRGDSRQYRDLLAPPGLVT